MDQSYFDPHNHWLGLFISWLLVGLTQMSPLQWMQFIAAICATCYSLAMLFFLLRDRRRRK
jgi:hypothetical protein